MIVSTSDQGKKDGDCSSVRIVRFPYGEQSVSNIEREEIHG